MNSTPIEQKTRVGKCFIIYANRMIYFSCFRLQTMLLYISNNSVFFMFVEWQHDVQTRDWGWQPGQSARVAKKKKKLQCLFQK